MMLLKNSFVSEENFVQPLPTSFLFFVKNEYEIKKPLKNSFNNLLIANFLVTYPIKKKVSGANEPFEMSCNRNISLSLIIGDKDFM